MLFVLTLNSPMLSPLLHPYFVPIFVCSLPCRVMYSPVMLLLSMVLRRVEVEEDDDDDDDDDGDRLITQLLCASLILHAKTGTEPRFGAKFYDSTKIFWVVAQRINKVVQHYLLGESSSVF